LTHGLLVERCERGLLGRVVEQQEAPILLVASTWGPHGSIENARLNVERDRIGLDPAHGAGRVKGLMQFHGPTLRLTLQASTLGPVD